MLRLLQLKGLSTLLKRLVTANGQTCQEVQCLQAEGGRIVACANSPSEVALLSKVLGKIGAAGDTWRVDLKPAALAMYQWSMKPSGIAPVKTPTGGSIWTDEDYGDALEALADLKEWRADFAALRASNMMKVGGTASAGTKLRELVEQGYGHFALSTLEGSTFPITGRKEALEVGGDGEFALVQSAGPNIHAEQSLLLALASHLSLGGKAHTVNVAGHKLPCDRCLKVLKAFSGAYGTVYQASINYDNNNAQSAKTNSPTEVITLPDTGSKPELFVKFHTHFTGIRLI
jgi:cytidine deaminase